MSHPSQKFIFVTITPPNILPIMDHTHIASSTIPIVYGYAAR